MSQDNTLSEAQIDAALHHGSKHQHLGKDVAWLSRGEAVRAIQEGARLAVAAHLERTGQSVTNDAAHLGWKACQRQVFALSEDFINRHPQNPTDFDRGVYYAAKQFSKAFSAFGPDDCDELRKALDAATPPEAATAEAADVHVWFCALPEGRKAVLRDDKWMLARAAFDAGKAQAAPAVQAGAGEHS